MSQPLNLLLRSPDEKAAAHERGRDIYNFRCYYCHGYSGNAKTLAATFLDPVPRDFSTTSPATLSRKTMLMTVTHGNAGTAMKAFDNTLTEEEIVLAVDFVRTEFMERKAENTRYHTPENGWSDHEEKYAPAFPFARGDIPIDTPWESLSVEQQQGKRVFMNSCISCHDRAKVLDEGVIWDPRPVSYPRNSYSHRADGRADTVTGATPYAEHDVTLQIAGLTPLEKKGEVLWLANCAFCHGANGTGKNWIGSFLEPHPRNLTDEGFMSGMNRERLRHSIREGLPGTTMPAWKSVLSESQLEAVMAYISRAFHPVAGIAGEN
ncbi:MAG: c-type cytochrome [Gammaproteobacteria bacterium]|nr:c-type cytochrome [Gammaproteobacteria bacterium]